MFPTWSFPLFFPFPLSFLLSPLLFPHSASISHSPSLSRFLRLHLTQTWFVDLVVRGLENGSWLKQECVIPACNHIAIQGKLQILISTCSCTCVQIYCTYLCLSAYLWVHVCVFLHAAPPILQWNHMKPTQPIILLPPSSHTDQQLVKCWPLSFTAPLFPVHSHTAACKLREMGCLLSVQCACL